MKKITLLLIVVLAAFTLKAQVLTLPYDYANSGAIRDSLTHWTSGGGLIPFDDNVNSTTSYRITSDWAPENTILNDIESNGGNTTEWPLYFRVIDSTFFDEEVHDLVGSNSKTLEGRYTSNNVKWANFIQVSHEVWYNSFNGHFIVLAQKDDGTLMTLEEVLTIRNSYTQITGYYTVNGRLEINQNNLYKRVNYNTYTKATDL